MHDFRGESDLVCAVEVECSAAVLDNGQIRCSMMRVELRSTSVEILSRTWDILPDVPFRGEVCDVEVVNSTPPDVWEVVGE